MSIMKTSRLLPGMIFLLAATSCGSSGTTAELISRAPENVPEAFVPAEGVVFDATSCKSPLIDPDDGTEIMMIRSHSTFGDYLGPEGKYGLRKRELLRINCSTGEVIGIVKR